MLRKGKQTYMTPTDLLILQCYRNIQSNTKLAHISTGIDSRIYVYGILCSFQWVLCILKNCHPFLTPCTSIYITHNNNSIQFPINLRGYTTAEKLTADKARSKMKSGDHIGVNRLRPLEHCDLGFESRSKHGCLCAFILSLCYSVCGQRPCDGLIPRPRRPTDCV
jgi:hypothetical protein